MKALECANIVLIKAIKVSKNYGVIKKTQAVVGVDLEIKPGECMCIVGSNGAGKTTLLKLLANITIPSSGVVLSSCAVSFSPETMGEYNNLTAKESVEFFSSFSGHTISPDIFLKKVGLSADINRTISSFSKGMKRKTMLAMMAASDPDVYVLDEPFEGLDPDSSADLAKQINELKQTGKGFLVSSHDLSFVEMIADKVAFMKGGSIKGVHNTKLLSTEYSVYFTSSMEQVYRRLNELNLRYSSYGYPHILIHTNLKGEVLSELLFNNGLRFSEFRKQNYYEMFRGEFK